MQDLPDSLEQRAAQKAFATIVAAAALKGIVVLNHADGRFTISRWMLSTEVDTLDQVVAKLRAQGVRI